MDKETKNKLIDVAKESKYLTLSWEYVTRDEYKQIDKMYEMDKKEVVNILYNMALDTTLETYFDNINYIFILHYLLLEHEDVNDDVTYLKSMYRKLVLEIFENDKYVKIRGFGGLTFVGFTKDEAENLYRSYVETETDPDVIKKYKYEILKHEYERLYPGLFHYIIHILEMHEPSNDKLERLQANIDMEVKNIGEKTINEWAKLFLDNKYASKNAKDLLKQVKIGDSTW